MQGYKEIPQSDEPTFKPQPLGDESESPCNGVHRPKALRVLLYILLLINAGLLVANAGASASMRASLAQVLPVHDPRKLARPDQYIGIPETSRYKSERTFELLPEMFVDTDDMFQPSCCATKTVTWSTQPKKGKEAPGHSLRGWRCKGYMDHNAIMCTHCSTLVGSLLRRCQQAPSLAVSQSLPQDDP